MKKFKKRNLLIIVLLILSHFILAIILAPLISRVKFNMFYNAAYQECMDWVGDISKSMFGNEIENLKFMNYDSLSEKYKELISKKDFYTLNAETMIDFFKKINQVPYEKCSLDEEFNFKTYAGSDIITSNGRYFVEFDFLMRPDFFTLKPTVQYWQITILER